MSGMDGSAIFIIYSIFNEHRIYEIHNTGFCMTGLLYGDYQRFRRPHALPKKKKKRK